MKESAVDTLAFVQRLFSMFPQGGPGIALVFLRASVAGIFLFRFWVDFHTALWMLLAAMFVVVCLVVGFLTPVLAAVVCLAGITGLVLQGGGDVVMIASVMLNAAALALLGPGAYSVDAWLYGRRVVVVPGPRGMEGR